MGKFTPIYINYTNYLLTLFDNFDNKILFYTYLTQKDSDYSYKTV